MKKLLFGAVIFGVFLGIFGGVFAESKPTTPPTPVLTDLPHLSIDTSRITVSGVSSGAFMAVQLHIAHSNLFKGVGSVAGGIWECTKGDSGRIQTCMSDPAQIQVSEHLDLARERATRGEIDALSNLGTARVVIFASPQDAVTKFPAADRLEEFYRAFTPASQITRLTNATAAHGFPTLSYGNECDRMGVPWILNCNDDVAGKILATIDPNPGNPKGIPDPAAFVYFDQTPYSKSAAKMFAWGAAYIPQVCKQVGVQCGVHVALHGCQMNPDFIQKQFIENAGYNEWAETNKLVVLYPQTAKGPDNPAGCWDWFALTGPNYATKAGEQIVSIRAMLSELGVN